MSISDRPRAQSLPEIGADADLGIVAHLSRLLDRVMQIEARIAALEERTEHNELADVEIIRHLTNGK
jgi:hypothetical protein